MDTATMPVKPLGHKSYGSIPHLPGSRRGPADKGLSVEQARICTTRVRDRHDFVVVQEKLDGSNVSVALKDGQILALGRAGYLAQTSKYEQHQLFAYWVRQNEERFRTVLKEGERLCGEWLAQAHGTRYNLPHEPFVAFDLMVGTTRATYQELVDRVVMRFMLPRMISAGNQPISIQDAMGHLDAYPERHGALDPIEGAVWRVERKGVVDFLGKYVRPEKVDGCYLPELSGKEAIWNWRP